MPVFLIREFRPDDQKSARNLIESGMRERWGWLDPSANPDLHDIFHAYIAQGHYFCVAECSGLIVGTGAIKNGEIVRVSVDEKWRRWGLGRAITIHLIQKCKRDIIQVETNTSWHSARALYESLGFEFSYEKDGETHYLLRL